MKIIELLKSLTEEELQRFDKFIMSPYFNENKEIIIFYKTFLLKHLSKKKIGTNQKDEFLIRNGWKDSKFRKRSNEVLELVVEFVTIENRRNSSLKNKLEKYKSILAYNWKESLPNKRKSIYEFKSIKRAWSEIELAEYYIFLKEQIDSDQFSADDTLLLYAEIAQVKKEFLKCSDVSSYLDLNNLQQANYVLDKSVFKLIEPLNNDLVILYENVKKLFEGKPYPRLLEKIKIQLTNKDIQDKVKYKLLVHCIGYMTTLLNKGALKVNNTIFDLYKFGIENQLLIIEVIDYRNITYFACKSGEFDWALNFVEEYRTHLPKEDQESAYSFTKARTLWYAKDWQGVISTLRNVEYKDMTYALITRAYVMTCYYELDEDDALDSFIKAFKVFLRRKRNISKRRKDAFYGFTTVIGDLTKARERNDHKRLDKARQELEDNPSIPNQDWLIEKIEELESIIPKPKKS